ncbi:Ig-like domain-containing protein [Pseudomonas aeruginosa]|uniref:Big-1 domain-containing protein n=1 Tax=Pseudomonas aeruginosa TaxID=287 RepID=A0A844NV41_PSEAI|nr:Ig-like domain-containing protein [Pseudomonas aeruginosa]MUH94375.1 hypothetical protein [Pseudomonas aeruginosa]MUI39442.1 hypothetical protein [Pseudomonas aeruginosa]
MGLTIVIQATPGSLAALGEQATLVATVQDYDGNNAGSGVVINWTTSDGGLSAAATTTDANGQTAVILTSSHTLGGATVTATSPAEGGSGQITVPFTDKWVATSATYSAWQNSGAPYSCTAWSPDASTIASGTAFTQSAICYQNQVAYQQNREVSLITGQVRNVGSLIPLYQTLQVTVTQAATGTKQSAPSCFWDSFTKHGVNSDGVWTRTTSNTGGPGTNFLLYLGKYVGEVTYIGDTFIYNGAEYSIGKFRQSTCLGKNCTSSRAEYEVCSVP